MASTPLWCKHSQFREERGICTTCIKSHSLISQVCDALEHWFSRPLSATNPFFGVSFSWTQIWQTRRWLEACALATETSSPTSKTQHPRSGVWSNPLLQALTPVFLLLSRENEGTFHIVKHWGRYTLRFPFAIRWQGVWVSVVIL